MIQHGLRFFTHPVNSKPFRYYLLLLTCIVVVFGQVSDIQAAERLPEEIIVTDSTPSWQLREEMREAQVRAFAIYNDLNEEDIYDVVCFWDTPLGTRIRYWKCRPRFFLNASAAMGQAIVNLAPDEYSPEQDYFRHIPLFDQNLNMARSLSPELRAAIREYEDLKAVVDETSLRESE